MADPEVELEGIRARIRGQEADYQAALEPEIQNVKSPALRRSAERGRAEVSKDVDELDNAIVSIRKAFDDWKSKAKDIHTALNADLSEDTLSSLQPDIEDAGKEATKLTEGLRSIKYELGELADALRRT